MESALATVVIAVLCAIVGFGAAFFFGRARPVQDQRRVAELEAQLAASREQAQRSGVQAAEQEKEASTLRAQLMEAVQRSASFEERARQGEEMRGTIREREMAIARLAAEVSQLREKGAELATRLEEERQQSDEKLALLESAKVVMENAFKSLSSEALRQNNQSFLDLAKTSLNEFHQGAKGDLEKRQVAIDALVAPVQASLKSVDEKILALEKARESAYGELRAQFALMSEAQGLLRNETSNLVRALRQPHVRGRWGEVQLRRVVELAGMLNHCDFAEQETAETEEGRVRPDLVVKLPGGRQIVVDAKAPVIAYMDAHDALTEEERREKLRQHAQLVRGHLTSLSRKSYWEQFEPTPEVVVMFIPGESFAAAALEADPELMEFGFTNNVIVASPTSLIALLRAVAYGWRQESIAENAREISQLGQELHKRLGDMAEHLAKVGTGLEGATMNYNRAIASLESRVLVSARKFRDLGATSQGAEIVELKLVEGTARRLQSPESKPAGLFDDPSEPDSGNT
jgi:DNA recombination protein RmuC